MLGSINNYSSLIFIFFITSTPFPRRFQTGLSRQRALESHCRMNDVMDKLRATKLHAECLRQKRRKIFNFWPSLKEQQEKNHYDYSEPIENIHAK